MNANAQDTAMREKLLSEMKRDLKKMQVIKPLRLKPQSSAAMLTPATSMRSAACRSRSSLLKPWRQRLQATRQIC